MARAALFMSLGAILGGLALLSGVALAQEDEPEQQVWACISSQEPDRVRVVDNNDACRLQETPLQLAGLDEVNELISDLDARVAELEETVAGLASDEDLGAVDARVTDLESTVSGQEPRLGTAEDAIAALEATFAGVSREEDAEGNDTLLFTEMNLQLVNGEGATDTTNRLGNLIIGYNDDPVALEPAERGGSHYLVVGDGHRYSSYGGAVLGQNNTASAPWATVTGGARNTANGWYSSVSGGRRNTASGDGSSVSGGGRNTANSVRSSVSGGWDNTASNWHSSVSGGGENTADGTISAVSGGRSNTVTGDYSSVSGGDLNTASGDYSSVSGGRSNEAAGTWSSILGGLEELVDSEFTISPTP